MAVVRTCAHNFVSEDEDGELIDHTDIYFYLCCNGDHWVRFKVDCFFYHEKHNNKPISGFDYAIGILSLPYEFKRPEFNVKNYPASDKLIINSQSCFIGQEDALKAKGCEVQTTGYPDKEGS